MDYQKRKINPIIILAILFLFQKSFGSNYIKNVNFEYFIGNYINLKNNLNFLFLF